MTAMTLPEWMTPVLHSPPPSAPLPLSVKHAREELLDVQMELAFPDILDRVHNGEPLSQIIREDPRNLDIKRCRAWIMKDPQRQELYYEARRIGAEAIEDEMIAIADAVDNPMEDINRSKLRLDTRRFLLQTWNRKRYTEVKQLDVNNITGISITQAMTDAANRVIEGHSMRVIDEDEGNEQT